MEYIEHKIGSKSKNIIKKAGKFGPIWGSLLGIFPQCGFSVSATNLYAGRVITLGTLISVYLATSDEMLPILISNAISPTVILKILGMKFIIGMLAGILIDFVINKMRINKKETEENEIVHMCEEEKCHCEEKGIFKSALKHTINIYIYIVLIIFIVNIVVDSIGHEAIANFILNKPIIGPMLAALIGLIPNCAASVIITNMYLENLISFGSMMAGLLTGAGVGVAVLLKTNKRVKENVIIISVLYALGAISGIIIELIGLSV